MASSATKDKPLSKSRQQGKRLPPREAAARDAEIVTAKMRGMSWQQIANTFELSKDRVRDIVAEYKATNPSLRVHDPIEIADLMIDGYLADIEELIVLGATTKDGDMVKVNCVRNRMTAREKITELLQAIGVLPNDLGELRIEIDARVTAERVVAVLNEHEVPTKVKDELIAVLEGQGTERPQLEAA